MLPIEVDISVKNKVSDKQKFISEHFKSILESQFKVTFLLINSELESSKMLDKIFTKSIEALSEIGNIQPPKYESKTLYIIQNDFGELRFKLNSTSANYKKEKVYEVCIEGDFELLEQYRTFFIKELSPFCLTMYCIEDEISNAISIAAYPIVREMENSLREYLVRFFSKRFGSKWWENNTTQGLKAKVAERKKSGGSWHKLNMELYNIDFDELTILLEGRFGKTDGKAVLDALDIIVSHRENEDEFNEQVSKLRNKFLDNWEKFFGQEIKIKNFLADWKEMYEVRCEVAHNSLLSLNRFIKLTELHRKLKENLVKLIDEQRIIKSPKYELLEEILSMQFKFTNDDVESLIKDSFLLISSVNFGCETMRMDEFNEKILSLKDEFQIFGDLFFSETQVSGLDEGEDIQFGRPSVNVKFACVPEEVVNALQLGLSNNKFLF